LRIARQQQLLVQLPPPPVDGSLRHHHANLIVFSDGRSTSSSSTHRLLMPKSTPASEQLLRTFGRAVLNADLHWCGHKTGQQLQQHSGWLQKARWRC
jgi:hypothetical protein